MKEARQDLFDHFPMQAALGLYSLHKYPPDEDEDISVTCPSTSGKEASDTCT